jgi:hypothetical protein
MARKHHMIEVFVLASFSASIIFLVGLLVSMIAVCVVMHTSWQNAGDPDVFARRNKVSS